MASKDDEKNETTSLLGGPGKGARVRSLTRMSLVAIMYFSVAGGPEGTETMVQEGGPLATFFGIILLGVIFAVPLALMTTELSTMYPENGGFVLWAKGAFGDAAGGMAGWMQFSFSAVDSALYPGLFVVYLSQTLQTEFGPEWTLWLQAGFICSITALNLGGIDSVGHGSMAMMLFLLLPFALVVLIAFTGIFSGTTITGWPFHIENLLETVPEPNWPQFMLVLIWNMGLWESASVCSGEVDNIAEQFPPALFITVILVVLNYVLPIAAFVGMDNDFTQYENGHYIDIMHNVAGAGWATWLGLSQCVSAAGLFTNGIVKNSFMICGMGEQGMLPTVMASRLPYTNAPYFAIGLTLAVTIFMVWYGDFKAVLGVDMLIYCLNLLLEIASLFHLRHIEPNTERPYKIPVDGIWLYLMYTPAVAICLYVVFSAKFMDLIVSGILIGVGAAILYGVHVAQQQAPDLFTGVDDVMHVEHHEPADNTPKSPA